MSGSEINISIIEKDKVSDCSLLKVKSISTDEYLNYKSTRKSKVVVYTAISGGFDNLIQHKYISKNFDYVCYTDTSVETPGIWEIRPLEDRGYDKNRNAKYYKIFPHELFPEYEYSIWIDGNIDVLNDDLEMRVYDLIDQRKIISANVHFERSCIYDEAGICMAYNIGETDIIEKQIEYISREGFPKGFGLYEMNLIFRDNKNTRILKLMADWWDMIIRFSRRDQLSFMFVLWKNNLLCEPMYDNTHRLRPGFKFFAHNKTIYASVYVDSGQGFRYKDLVVNPVVLKTGMNFKTDFDLTSFKNIKSLRFEPLEGNFCSLKFYKVTLVHPNDEKVLTWEELKSTITCNGEVSENGELLFYTTDPHVFLPFSGEIDNIIIEGELSIIGFDQVIQYKDQVIQYKDQVIQYKDQVIQYKDQVIASIYSSYSMRVGKTIIWMPRIALSFLRKLRDIIKVL